MSAGRVGFAPTLLEFRSNAAVPDTTTLQTFRAVVEYGMDKLVLSYRYDPSYFNKSLDRDDFGRLSLRVETERFTGEGGFWVQWQDVVEYGQSLNVYPIATDKPIVTQWGYAMQDGDDLIIRISIGAQNLVGDLLVSVVVADDYEPSQRLSASFRSGYSALDMFQRDIARMMDREIPEAVLHGY